MKTRMVHVRLTEEEYSELVLGAEKRGLRLASFLREKLGCSVQKNGRPRKSEKKKKEPVKYDGDPAGVKKRMGAIKVGCNCGTCSYCLINKTALDLKNTKPGESVDQFGFKRSLAKPGKK